MLRDYQRLKRQDQEDVLRMAYANSGYLHNCTNTPKCMDAVDCDMCFNAARLAVQYYRPIIERRTVQTFINYFNAGCTMPHGED